MSTWQKFNQLVIFATGTTAVGGIISGSFPQYIAYFAGVPVILSLVDLIFRTPEKAAEHSALRKRFKSLETEIRTNESTPENLIRWQKQLDSIESDEPPTMHALAAHAINLAGADMERPERSVIPKLDMFFRNWRSFQGKFYEITK